MHSSVSPHSVRMGVGGVLLFLFCIGGDRESSMKEAEDVHKSWIIQGPKIPLSNLGLS